MPRHVLRWEAGLTAVALLAGCVTINIYFPAAAAEKAADTIIDEVWRTRKTPTPAPTELPPPTAPVPLP
jgi:hypothetical protein